MAIDTENKRRTSVLFQFNAGQPIPDGVIDANDRRQFLGLYAGIYGLGFSRARVLLSKINKLIILNSGIASDETTESDI